MWCHTTSSTQQFLTTHHRSSASMKLCSRPKQNGKHEFKWKWQANPWSFRISSTKSPSSTRWCNRFVQDINKIKHASSRLYFFISLTCATSSWKMLAEKWLVCISSQVSNSNSNQVLWDRHRKARPTRPIKPTNR